MQTEMDPPCADGELGSVAATTAVDDVLEGELLKAGADLERSISFFRRHRLSREAAIHIPKCTGFTRFVTCTNWDHCFPEKDRDTKVRWVFDRRSWHIAVLHLRASDGWIDAGPNEVLDVTENLVFANLEALYHVGDWGSAEVETLPFWAAAPTVA